jgi:type IV secretory pathway VirB10-like protein
MATTEAPAAVETQAPQKTFEELTVPADSVLGLQIETTLTSERAKVEDSVNARVTRDVRVGDHVAIPAGSKVVGSVTLVDRGGKVKEKARLGIRFHTLVLADGSRQSINTDTIYREGSSPAGESTAKIAGGAVAGAILGAILGGGKGAAIGGTVGAGGGTAAVMAGGRNAATVQAGSTMTARIVEPVTITVEREEEK